MKLDLETESYDKKRFGKPWIASVVLNSGRPTFEWGEWVGTPGEAGALLLEAEARAVIAYGQKDRRDGTETKIQYGVVDGDGDIDTLESRTEAVAILKAETSGSAV
jgi:hypothetical protein